MINFLYSIRQSSRNESMWFASLQTRLVFSAENKVSFSNHSKPPHKKWTFSEVRIYFYSIFYKLSRLVGISNTHGKVAHYIKPIEHYNRFIPRGMGSDAAGILCLFGCLRWRELEIYRPTSRVWNDRPHWSTKLFPDWKL